MGPGLCISIFNKLPAGAAVAAGRGPHLEEEDSNTLKGDPFPQGSHSSGCCGWPEGGQLLNNTLLLSSLCLP